MRIEWLENDNRQSYIRLAEHTANKFDLREGQKITVSLGGESWKAAVTVCEDCAPDVIGISQKLRSPLEFPNQLTFQVIKRGNELRLGPVIALLVNYTRQELNGRKLSRLRDYFRHSELRDGLLYICAKDSIDVRSRTVIGFCYHLGGTGTGEWHPGIFPFPDSAYNRAVLTKERFEAIEESSGGRIFNPYTEGSFNKRELWERLSPIPELLPHLPHTEPLKDIHTIDRMLQLHEKVYLKPAGGTLSQGVVRLEKENGRYCAITPVRGKTRRAVSKLRFEHTGSFAEWIDGLSQSDYIVQQAITMKRYENRVVDFRAIVQKSDFNRWDCTAIFAKFGKPGSIISNFTSSGYLLPANKALRLLFGIGDADAERMACDIEQIALDLGNVFDAYGLYGDLGIDLMVDETGHIWILEANTLDTYHRFPLHVNDRRLYQSIVTNPLRFAKYISGFHG
ncbi:YheC/YheD family protein [Paenibacillus thermotolerans]|uniref:YheC/YheD family endospore coat-associated protein n=1 Tax=Paenibacillus thermotolerans TaxID=3027807 RepID=UPI00236871E2|nr:MULTISPECIES: YheC/YheD family protein [unclassified Paenibacillus]